MYFYFKSIRVVILTSELVAIDTIRNNISQCSTLVRNTVVRATFKVNGKPPILGSRRPLTPWPIDLKFHMGDYVGDMKPQAKMVKIGPQGRPGKGVKCEGQLGLFFICKSNVKRASLLKN